LFPEKVIPKLSRVHHVAILRSVSVEEEYILVDLKKGSSAHSVIQRLQSGAASGARRVLRICWGVEIFDTLTKSEELFPGSL
jgi:hypothetical protein